MARQRLQVRRARCRRLLRTLLLQAPRHKASRLWLHEGATRQARTLVCTAKGRAAMWWVHLVGRGCPGLLHVLVTLQKREPVSAPQLAPRALLVSWPQTHNTLARTRTRCTQGFQDPVVSLQDRRMWLLRQSPRSHKQPTQALSSGVQSCKLVSMHMECLAFPPAPCRS